MTPQQMRALADELQAAAAIDFGVSGDTMFAAQAALRTAADELEAVEVLLPTTDPGSPYMYDPWTDESVDATNIEEVVRAAASAGWSKGSYELARRIREVLESEPSDD